MILTLFAVISKLFQKILIFEFWYNESAILENAFTINRSQAH